jgi:hypothetical protein
MSFRHDRRGQSVVVGTVILFGFLILAMATYQVQFVPTENEEIEFEHSQQVEGEFLDLRNAILQAGSTGAAQSKRIQLGTRYPQRTFFLNPPSASGSLQTTDVGQVRIENVSVEEGGNAEAYWENNDLTFDTRSLRYRPNYNEYRGASRLIYEHSAVAAEFENEAVLLRSEPTVVRGESGPDSRISLTFLSGNISANGVDARNVDVAPVSQGRGSVRIVPDSGDSRIVLPTAVENETALAERWNRTTDATVTVHDNNRIQIALNGNHSLSLSEVSIDGGGATEPAYIVPVTGNGTVGDSVGVEVRDKYNNPVADAEVSFDGPTENTNGDGRAFFEPDAPDDYNATINGGGESYESVPFTVTEAGGSGSGNQTFETKWVETGPIEVPEGETRDLEVEITDRETGYLIEDARIDYSIARRSGSGTATLYPPTRENHDGTDTVEFDAGGAVEGDSYDAYVSAGDDVDRLRIDITEAPTPTTPVFDVRITDVNDPVIEGEPLDVDYTVENTGGEGGTQNVRFLVDGEEINEREVNLTSGEQVTGSFTYQTEQGDSPNVDVRVESDDDFDTRTATVNAPAQFDVSITNVNEPITEGEDLNVDYTVENTGDETDTQTIELLDFDDQVVDSIEVTLDGGETTSGTLTWSTAVGDAESDEITVRSEDDTAVQGVTIEAAMASQVSGVDGTVGQSNIPGGGRAVEFDISADQSVEIDAFSVETQNDMSGRTFSDTGSSFDGQSLPATVNGEATIELSEFSGSGSLSIDENFISDSSSADIIVTLEFSDGSELSLNIT